MATDAPYSTRMWKNKHYLDFILKYINLAICNLMANAKILSNSKVSSWFNSYGIWFSGI